MDETVISSCAQCAYDVRGIDPAGVCPECGTAIELSRAKVIRDWDRRVRLTVQLGAFASGCGAMMIVVVLLMMLMALLLEDDPFGWVMAVFGFGGPLVLACGWWGLSRAQRVDLALRRADKRRCRNLARHAIFLLLCDMAWGTAFAIGWYSNDLGFVLISAGVSYYATLIALPIGEKCSLRVARMISNRAAVEDMDDLIVFTRAAMWGGIVACVGLAAAPFLGWFGSRAEYFVAALLVLLVLALGLTALTMFRLGVLVHREGHGIPRETIHVPTSMAPLP